ncbi:MAG TPA: hypothetical protein VFM54_13305 [Micromonosporaceae bacterium]|nr:hypothetical protein [Micromonosporaceae bacterium]
MSAEPWVYGGRTCRDCSHREYVLMLMRGCGRRWCRLRRWWRGLHLAVAR